MALQELECLRVVAGRHLDLVAALAEEADQRPEDQHVGGCRDVDPDLQLASLAGVGSCPAEPGSAAACRRCRHGALRAPVVDPVPSGPAPAAAPQETDELIRASRPSLAGATGLESARRAVRARA